VSFRVYGDMASPSEGLAERPFKRSYHQPGTGEDASFHESAENFQQYPAGSRETLGGRDAYGNLNFGWFLAVGGLDYVRSYHDFQDEANGNHSTLSGGVGFVGDIQAVTP
jgi:hypothetical protein